MVATHVKKIKHSMLCVTGVYLREITNTNFVILHLNASGLSVCSSHNAFAFVVSFPLVSGGMTYCVGSLHGHCDSLNLIIYMYYHQFDLS